MRIYLDMCSLQRPLDDQTPLRVHLEAEAVLGVLALCETGQAELVGSVALRFEQSRNPHPLRKGFAQEVLALAALTVDATPTVTQRAHDYVEQGIQPLDALHLACAVEARADYFCTCDDRLLRRAKQVATETTRAVSPLELIDEIEP